MKPIVRLDSNHALFANQFIVTSIWGSLWLWDGSWRGPYQTITALEFGVIE